MKKLKILIIVAIAMLAAFIIAMIISDKIINSDTDVVIVTEEDVSIPVVYAEVDGSLVNPMYGYVQDMDPGSIRQSITPMKDENLILYIDPKGNSLEAVNYTVYDTTGKEVLWTGSCSEDKAQDNYIVTKYVLDGLKEDLELCFRLKITTKDGKEYLYYTRIKYGPEYRAADKLSFVQNFNTATFDKNNVNSLATFMEPDGRITSDFANIGINVSLDALSFGALNMNEPQNRSIYIKEINRETATIAVKYSAESNYKDQKHTYDMTDYFRMKIGTEKMLLLNYKRTMEENELKKTLAVNENGIDLGIGDITSLSVDGFEDDSETFIGFATNRALWHYDKSANILTKVIAFDGDYDLDDFSIKVLAVERNGDIYFILYGRIPEGARAGQVGTAFYHYQVEDNGLNEVIFIPSNKGGEMLQKDVEKLTFISDNGFFYLMNGNSIYAINYLDRTVEEAVANMGASKYALEPDKGLLALYNYDGTEIMNSFNLVHLNSRETKVIKASEGAMLEFVGFFCGDIVYGEGNRTYIDESGNSRLLFNRLVICDKNLNVIKEYTREDRFIRHVQILDKSISFDLVVGNPDGSYSDIGQDYIISNVGTVDGSIKTDMVKDYIYGLQRFIIFDGMEPIVPITQNSRLVEDVANKAVAVEGVDNLESYYLYAEGKLIAEFSHPADAINYSNNGYQGTVVARDNTIIWQRAEKIEAVDTINVGLAGGEGMAPVINAFMNFAGEGAAVTADESKSLYANIAANVTNMKVIDLKGITLDDALYEVYKGRPVAVKAGDDKYLIIVAYNQYNLFVINSQTGGTELWDKNSSAPIFNKYGNEFVSIY